MFDMRPAVASSLLRITLAVLLSLAAIVTLLSSWAVYSN